MSGNELTRSPLTTVRRKTDRATYERVAADAILDVGLVAHVGFEVDGQPFVIPMAYGRDGERLLLHGSVASRLLRTLDAGVAVCATVTLLDGLVLARSQFHHSMNYRSVVIVGTACRIRDIEDARAALGRIVDHIVPGRTAEARPPTDVELRQTTVLELPIDTASVKIRTGGPLDEEDDMTSPTWAGVLPVTTIFGTPEAGADLASGVPLPRSLTPYGRP